MENHYLKHMTITVVILTSVLYLLAGSFLPEEEELETIPLSNYKHDVRFLKLSPAHNDAPSSTLMTFPLAIPYIVDTDKEGYEESEEEHRAKLLLRMRSV